MIAVDQTTGNLQTPSVGAEGETKVLLCGKDGDNVVPVRVDENGVVATSATVAPAEGGATSAKQDTGNSSLASIDGKLPALADGRVPVAVGSLDTLATQATLAALSAKLPAAATPADNIANPSASAVMALGMGWNASTSQWGRPRIDSTNYYQVRSHPTAPGSTSRSTGLQVQRTAATFSCTPKVFRAWAAQAGFIALFNAASAVSDGAVPLGGHIYPIGAGETVVHEWRYNESFTTGLVIAHLSQVVNEEDALATVLHAAAHCMFTVQFD